MAIEVLCECGKRIKAKDSYAGKKAPCPSCSRPVLIPEQWIPLTKETPPQPEAGLDAIATPRRFALDRTLLIGLSVPCLMLVAFGIYLWRDNARKTLDRQVQEEVQKAYALCEKKDFEGAYAICKRVAALELGDDKLTNEDIEYARRSEKTLLPWVLEQRKQREQRERAAELTRIVQEEDQKRKEAFDLAFKEFDEAISRYKYTGNASDLTSAGIKRQMIDQLMDKYNRPLLPFIERAQELFADIGRDIGSHAWSAYDILREKGISSHPREIIEGGIFLAENSSYLDKGRKERSFQGYCFLYQRFREDGLTHDEAVAKMHELRKI